MIASRLQYDESEYDRADAARALGVSFIDSDDEIVSAANMSIAEIFEKYGEAHFRSGERRVIGTL